MDPFKTNFTFNNSKYATEDIPLSFSPIAQTTPITPFLFTTKPHHQIICPLLLDNSGNVLTVDPSGNPISYRHVTDSIGSPAIFNTDNTTFNILAPIVNNKIASFDARKAILGPLAPVSTTYESSEFELDGHCVNGSYGFSKRFLNTVQAIEKKMDEIKKDDIKQLDVVHKGHSISISVSIA